MPKRKSKVAPQKLICGVCLETLPQDRKRIQLPCKHKFCRSCIQEWATKCPQTPNCPTCKQLLTPGWLKRQFPGLSLQRRGEGQEQKELSLAEDEIRRETKECPGCHFRVVLIRGCNSVVCPRTACRTRFCFACGRISCTCGNRGGLIVATAVAILLLIAMALPTHRSDEGTTVASPPRLTGDLAVDCSREWSVSCNFYLDNLEQHILLPCRDCTDSELFNAEAKLATQLHNFRGKNLKLSEDVDALRKWWYAQPWPCRVSCANRYNAMAAYFKFWQSNATQSLINSLGL